MSNNYLPHIHVLAQDDRNRQIANGFLLGPNLNNRAVKVLPLPDGWKKTVEEFTKEYAPEMRQLYRFRLHRNDLTAEGAPERRGREYRDE